MLVNEMNNSVILCNENVLKNVIFLYQFVNLLDLNVRNEIIGRT